MDGLLPHAIALVALLSFSAFFSGSEAALFSLTRSQLRSMREGTVAGRRVARLLAEPRPLLVSILLGNLIVNIIATSMATAVMFRIFGPKGLGYAFLGMSALIMLVGEILPKTIALHWSVRFATLAIFPLNVFHTLVLPLRVPLSRISDAVIDRARSRIGQAKRSFTWEELLTALRISRREGSLGEFEYEILANVIEFRHKIVKEIMTPSIDVLSASVRTGRADLIRRFADSGHSRMPVFDSSTDDIIGVLHIKDLIDSYAAGSEEDLRSRLREPYFVQETTPIDVVYGELQQKKRPIAMVIDEYTSFAGVVTIEDILEELVGEIRDARDPKTQPYMKVGDRQIVVSGSMEIDEFNEVFDAALMDSEHETMAGFVIGLTGRIPREGESFEAHGYRFQIVSAQPNRIRKLRVERI
ncbi:MAG: HlyC/CorC family transporter [Candidatus Krumholzibacteriota bacterium]|nr:HlyC/CorC family transporter [Candidatus Krumholzibacteriota bacterium]